MLHKREIEILNILWGSGTAMTSADIVEAGNKLSQSTVQSVLRKLLKDNIVIVEGVTHSGNVLSRTFIPAAKSRKIAKQQILNEAISMINILGPQTVQELQKALHVNDE